MSALITVILNYFLCEHDVYTTLIDFTQRQNTFYYNQNVWYCEQQIGTPCITM
jgi:hypothetical protein